MRTAWPPRRTPPSALVRAFLPFCMHAWCLLHCASPTSFAHVWTVLASPSPLDGFAARCSRGPAQPELFLAGELCSAWLLRAIVRGPLHAPAPVVLPFPCL